MVNKKTFIRLSQKLNRKIVEKNSRTEKFMKVIDFVRLMFDYKRSHPFAQFYNKLELNDIKTRAR